MLDSNYPYVTAFLAKFVTAEGVPVSCGPRSRLTVSSNGVEIASYDFAYYNLAVPFHHLDKIYDNVWVYFHQGLSSPLKLHFQLDIADDVEFPIKVQLCLFGDNIQCMATPRVNATIAFERELGYGATVSLLG